MSRKQILFSNRCVLDFAAGTVETQLREPLPEDRNTRVAPWAFEPWGAQLVRLGVAPAEAAARERRVQVFCQDLAAYLAVVVRACLLRRSHPPLGKEDHLR